MVRKSSKRSKKEKRSLKRSLKRSKRSLKKSIGRRFGLPNRVPNLLVPSRWKERTMLDKSSGLSLAERAPINFARSIPNVISATGDIADAGFHVAGEMGSKAYQEMRSRLGFKKCEKLQKDYDDLRDEYNEYIKVNLSLTEDIEKCNEERKKDMLKFKGERYERNDLINQVKELTLEVEDLEKRLKKSENCINIANNLKHQLLDCQKLNAEKHDIIQKYENENDGEKGVGTVKNYNYNYETDPVTGRFKIDPKTGKKIRILPQYHNNSW
jgi:hypothetical protein